ncbi:MAG: hypothetical protein J7M14_05215, partial [Planctomycetes bacterium]|nr:hypothetical protein [Planctomycetota bacterium]
MNNIDFLPERIRKRHARKARLVRQGYLLAACVMALALLGGVRHNRSRRAQGELEMLEGRLARSDSQLAALESLERQRAELFVIQRIEGHLGSRIKVIDILGELEALLSPSMA